MAAACHKDAVAHFLGNKSDELNNISVAGRARDCGMELEVLLQPLNAAIGRRRHVSERVLQADKIVLRSATGRERSSVNLEDATKLEQALEGVALFQRVMVDRE